MGWICPNLGQLINQVVYSVHASLTYGHDSVKQEWTAQVLYVGQMRVSGVILAIWEEIKQQQMITSITLTVPCKHLEQFTHKLTYCAC